MFTLSYTYDTIVYALSCRQKALFRRYPNKQNVGRKKKTREETKENDPRKEWSRGERGRSSTKVKIRRQTRKRNAK